MFVFLFNDDFFLKITKSYGKLDPTDNGSKGDWNKMGAIISLYKVIRLFTDWKKVNSVYL